MCYKNHISFTETTWVVSYYFHLSYEETEAKDFISVTQDQVCSNWQCWDGIQFNLEFVSTVGRHILQFSSVQLSRSVVSDSLQPHEPQHARPPCLSPTPGVYPNSCPLSQWYHPTISSSVVCFSFHLQSFPTSGSFQMSQLFASGGQSIGVSASASVLPMNTRDWFPLGRIGWISLQSKGLPRVFCSTTVQKHQFFGA